MVSVVIITYKRTQFIERAIKSVLSQTYQDFELIVVDDNDPDTVYRDELEKIMFQFKSESKIKYIQHEYNKNGAAARNTGISMAKGKYIAFLDDDDYFLPKRLENLVYILDKNEEYSGVYSSVIVTRNRKIIGLIEAKSNGNFKNELLLDKFSFGTGSNLFFRTEVVKALNGFNISFQRHQDIEFMIRFFKRYKLVSSYEPTVVKVQDDRANEPDLRKLIDVKKNYINSFIEEIEKMESTDKKEFYKINMCQILYSAIRFKEYSKFKNIKKEIKKYITIDLKSNIRFLTLFINNYLKIEYLKYYFVRKKVKKAFKNESSLIKRIEERGSLT